MHSPPPPLLRSPLPSPPAAHSSVSDNTSPFLSFLSVLILIAVIILIYAIFFAIKFNRLHRISGGIAAGSPTNLNASNTDRLVSITYKEAAHGRESTGCGGECPVCLSAFMVGEVVREVNPCKHLFHGACIDMWLCSHSDCPLCRAFIGTKRPKPPPPVVVDGDGDLRQGLPDSASLV